MKLCRRFLLAPLAVTLACSPVGPDAPASDAAGVDPFGSDAATAAPRAELAFPSAPGRFGSPIALPRATAHAPLDLATVMRRAPFLFRQRHGAHSVSTATFSARASGDALFIAHGNDRKPPGATLPHR